MRKKDLLLLLLAAAGYITSWAQAVDCFPVTSTSPSANPSGISTYNCIGIDYGSIEPPVSVPSSQNYDILSATGIYVTGESRIKPGTALANRLLIETSGIGIRRISPATGAVPRYEKLEFGITLPAEALTRISNFVNKIPNTPQLNPFDPLDVDIRADFDWEVQPNVWYTKGRQHGFYYKEYVLDTSGLSVDWHRDQVTIPENFRLRYAPTQEGNWRVKFTVMLNGIGTYATLYYYFTVVPSSNPGYMKVATGGKYFELGDNVFYPLGQNQPYPECVSEYCMDMNGLVTSPDKQWSYEPWILDRSPVKSYLMYHKVIQKMKEGGANYFRMFTNQWGLEVEFEELGNYYDRMEHAWEMDRILDKVHEQGMYMTWNMLLHTPLEDENTNYELKWDFREDDCGNGGWCYSTIPGVNEPEDVFTNTTAKRYYKNRLRYLVSRYGYSTNIGLMEMVSEINNVGQGYNYYPHPDTSWICIRDENSKVDPSYQTNADVVVPNTQAWQENMLSYIKNDLGHTEHLTGVSYTGLPDDADGIYSSPLVDYIGYNNYSERLDRFQYIHIAYEKYRNEQGLTKPMFNGEIGSGGAFIECDGMSDWIRNIWVMPFVGFAGAGMSWGHMFHLGFPYMQAYGKLGDFLEDVDFRDGSGITWAPVQDIRNDQKSETYAMRGQDAGDGRWAVGVILNRSYNYYTMGTDSRCTGLDSIKLNDLKFTDYNRSPLNVGWEGAPNRLKLPNMGLWKTYTIDWYNCWTGQWISQTEKTSDIAGDLYLEHPELSWNGTRPLVAYKIHPKNEEHMLLLDTLGQEEPITQTALRSPVSQTDAMTQISMHPNPARDVVYLSVPVEREGEQWQLTAVSGGILKKGILLMGETAIPINDLKPGVYLLTVTGHGNQLPQTFKLIKP